MQETEIKASIHGVATHISMFYCVYGKIPGEMVLTISSTLQHKTLTAAEGQQIASMTVKTLHSLHSDELFDL